MKKIQKIFLAGILTLLPVVVTFYLIYFLFNTLDNFLGNFLEKITQRELPGAGFLLSLVVVFLVGLLTTNLLGKRIIYWGEGLIQKIPLIKGIYTSTKQIVDAFSNREKDAFKKVVLLEYPRPGLYALGFVTGSSRGEIQAKTKGLMINVFVPTTPNPTSGMLVMVPEEDIIPLDMTVEEGLRVLISGGIASPPDSILAENAKNRELGKE
jgi:uncharacterized membrane protein